MKKLVAFVAFATFIATAFVSQAPATVNPACAQGTTYVAALDGTATVSFKVAAANLICGLVADGTFPQMLGAYLHANTSAANARVNAVNPGAFNLTEHGTCTFTPLTGITGDGSTCYEDPGFIPAANGGTVMTQNSASAGVCILNNRTTSQPWVSYGGTDGTQTIYAQPYLSGISGTGINDLGGGYTGSVTGTFGSRISSRTGPTTLQVYLNGSSIMTTEGSASTVLPAASIFELGYNNNGTPALFTTDQHAYWFFGGGLTSAQVASINNRFATFLSALGVTGCGGSSGLTGDFYFDSVAGLDTNNCLTTGTPCRAIAKANTLNYIGGHAINLKGGSNFTGCLVLSAANASGTSAASPITIQKYGTGAAPIITGNCGTGVGFHSSVVTLDSVSVTMNGIAVAGTGLGTGTEHDTCIIAQNSSGVGQPTFILENLDTTGCSQHIYTTSFSLAAGFPSACGSITVSLLNSTIHGASGITSADDTGLGGNRCGSPFVKPETTQGNIFFNIGGNTANSPPPNLVGNGGTWNGSTAGSVAQFNLAHDNGSNSFGCGSSFALWAANTVGLTMQFSEAYNHGNFTAGNAGQCDQGGYDWDQSSVGDIGQYLYSHHNYGPGYLMFDGFDGSIFRYSISENDQWGSVNVNGSDGGGAISMQPALTAFSIHNMTVFITGSGNNTTSPSCLSTSGGGSAGGSSNGLIKNNACWNSATNNSNVSIMLNGINSDPTITSLSFNNNDWYYAGAGTLTFAYQWGSNANTYTTFSAFQVATGQDANSITTNPSTGTWTAAGTCTWTPSSIVSWPPIGCPSSYSTISGAVKGTGIAISTPGTRDYYGNAIPGSGSCYNIGAYGVCP